MLSAAVHVFSKLCSWPSNCSEAKRKCGQEDYRESPSRLPENHVSPLRENSVFNPPPPKALLEHRSGYLALLRARGYLVPEGVTSDTTLYALYRLYEYFVIDHVTGYRNQLEYIWFKHWLVKDVPDPKDEDLARYAFSACIAALILSAFNERMELGLTRETPAILSPEEAEYLRTRPESSKTYQELPLWPEHVPAITETLFRPSHEGVIMNGFDDARASDAFKAKNILMWGPHIRFT